MKRAMILLIPVVILISVSTWAQETTEFPKAEVFGGFSVLSIGEGFTDRTNVFGFQASIAGNFHKNFGIVGDFGGQYENDAHVYEYLGGPQVTFRGSRANVFAHALFGGVTEGASRGSASAFMMGFGGGLDVSFSQHFGVRLFQFDWLPIVKDGNWNSKAVRFGIGMIIK